jgi:hypothetical protein
MRRAAQLAGARGAGLLVCAVALACASPPRPVTGEDRIAGARALDTSYRVKDQVIVPAPDAVEYVLPVGEYRPRHADDEGIFYAAPTGLTERAGFSKRVVPGGIYVASAPGRPFEHPAVWVERSDGRVVRLAMPGSALRRFGAVLAFAVDGEELPP